MSLSWSTVETEALKKIEGLRDSLERRSDPAMTDYLRGQIAGLRVILALPQELSKDEKLRIGDPGNAYKT